MKMSSVSILLLLIASWFFFCGAEEVLEAVPGIYSVKAVSNGLSLSATNTFRPVTNLTTTVHILVDCAVFVHYQITLESFGKDFYSKLQINDVDVGSLVHSGDQAFKTATGLYMVNLKPGYYKLGVVYKSPVAIHMDSHWDWQTAILQVVWAEDAKSASDSIKCSSSPTTANTYDNWGPLQDVEATLFLPTNRVMLSAYQFSAEMLSISRVVTALGVDGFHQRTSSFLKGYGEFLDLHGAWAGNAHTGIHWFNIHYRTPTKLSFTDCKENFQGNSNLYAMMLPPSCKAVTINPETDLSLSSSNTWAPTDVTYSFTLSKQSKAMLLSRISLLAVIITLTLLCVSVSTQSHKNTLYLWMVTLTIVVTLDSGKDPSAVEHTKSP